MSAALDFERIMLFAEPAIVVIAAFVFVFLKVRLH